MASKSFILPPESPEFSDLSAKCTSAHNTFVQHLMSDGRKNNCCYAPTKRYCAVGAELLAAYRGLWQQKEDLADMEYSIRNGIYNEQK